MPFGGVHVIKFPMKTIQSCLWFDHQAEEAAAFYTSLFKNSKVGKTARYGESAASVSGQKAGSVMTVAFELEGHRIVGLNGGPLFKFTPALSFFVWCDSEAEITGLWEKLSNAGEVRMGLDKYPWAPKYGWTKDKYGVEWQLILHGNKQKIAPAFLFVDALFGKGEEAIQYYLSIFKNSKIETIAHDEKSKSVMHCRFSLNGQTFVLSEGPGSHGYTFSTAFSLMAMCETQSEIDECWEKLSIGGTVEECGWLKDKYGVSWQVVPADLEKLVSGDPAKAERVMSAILKMKKLDIGILENAYNK
jgi:predicted 3-demethylubiquinone-9 3-methyltransferase (glyoxalase superfamily)